MYEETYRLFSHRADIKAKHSHITAKRKVKAKEDVEIIYALLTVVIIFIMACTLAIL